MAESHTANKKNRIRNGCIILFFPMDMKKNETRLRAIVETNQKMFFLNESFRMIIMSLMVERVNGFYSRIAENVYTMKKSNLFSYDISDKKRKYTSIVFLHAWKNTSEYIA